MYAQDGYYSITCGQYKLRGLIMSKNREAYIIYDDILPDAIKRTALAKQLLARKRTV